MLQDILVFAKLKNLASTLKMALLNQQEIHL